MIVAEKPGTPAEVLAHHGVKGQKWGVRQRFNAKNPTSREKADAIRGARARSNVKYEKVMAKHPSKEARKAAHLVYLKDPDRATAMRTTRGEKVVIGILAGVTAPTGIGVAVGVGLAGRVAYRRHVEKKQARGGYK